MRNQEVVEPPIFLPRLLGDLDAAQVPRYERTFASMNQVLASLDQKIIVNCTGLGARELCNDDKVKPVKGQLAMLPAQPNLEYLYSGYGYLFPRKDAVVVGGTEETEFHNDKPDLPTCRAILARVESIFEPSMLDMLTPDFLAARLAPRGFIRDK